MSLRAFHVVFVTFSVVLAAFVAAWAAGQYRLDHDLSNAVAAVGAFGFGGVLAAYGALFLRKTRHLH